MLKSRQLDTKNTRIALKCIWEIPYPICKNQLQDLVTCFKRVEKRCQLTFILAWLGCKINQIQNHLSTTVCANFQFWNCSNSLNKNVYNFVLLLNWNWVTWQQNVERSKAAYRTFQTSFLLSLLSSATTTLFFIDILSRHVNMNTNTYSYYAVINEMCSTL